MTSLLSTRRASNTVFAAWKRGDWQACLPKAALRDAQENPTLANVYLALQIKHAIDGIEVHDLATFHELLSQSAQNASWSRPALRLLCGQLQLNNRASAHDIVSRFFSGSCRLTSTLPLQRFPLALGFLHAHYPEKLRFVYRKNASLAVSLANQTACFDDKLIRGLCDQHGSNVERKRTVAIVGNGPSLLSQAYGQTIDDHDVVIRFNNPVLTDDYTRYSGERTDLLIISPNQAKKTPHPRIDALAISGINILQGESGYWSHLARLADDVTLAVFNQICWYRLVKELQAPPSAGLLAVASLARQSDLNISVFGFTADADAAANNASNAGNTGGKLSGDANGAHYGDQQIASTRHNWTAEARLVRRLVDSAPAVSLCPD